MMSEKRGRGRPAGQVGPKSEIHLLIPAPLLAVVDAEAGDQGVSRNALIIQAIRHYLLDRYDALALYDAWVEEQTGEPPPLDMARIALYRAAGLVS